MTETLTIEKAEKARLRPHQETWRRVKRYWYCYPMIAGTMALLFTFRYYPALSAFYHSFTIWDGFRPAEWVGLTNFREIFASELIFRHAFKNMLLLSLWQVIRATTLPLAAAALVYRIKKEGLAYFFRVLFVLPIVVPSVVAILVWRQLYEPNVGLFNEILKLAGLPPFLFLNSAPTALASLMFMGFPWIDGVGLLIYLAGLLAIPLEIIEAAIVDGASNFRRFFAIELPLIVPQIRLIVILNVIGSLQGFGWQLLVTGGGPAYSTTVPAWEMYRAAMYSSRFGVACAIGVVLFMVIFALTLVNNASIRSAVEYTAQ